MLYFEAKNNSIVLTAVAISWDKIRYAYSSGCIVSVIFIFDLNNIILNFTDYTKDTYNFNLSLPIPLNLTIVLYNQDIQVILDKYSIIIDNEYIREQIKTERLTAILTILLIFAWILSFIAFSCSP